MFLISTVTPFFLYSVNCLNHSHAEAMDTVMDISQMNSLPPDPIKSEASEGSGHESDTENTSTGKQRQLLFLIIEH